jgi:predicted transcriptional regulator
MEKDVFVDKVSVLQKQIRDLKYEICDLTDQYIAESEYVKEFPIGSIVKVVDNDSGTLVTLGFIEKYEVTSNYNLRPIILKMKKDGTVSKHHYFFSMFQDRLEKYEK